MSGFIPILSTVTAADVATAVRAELSTELARIDVATSTRMDGTGGIANEVWSDSNALTLGRFLALSD